jgi:hypothetical protein
VIGGARFDELFYEVMAEQARPKLRVHRVITGVDFPDTTGVACEALQQYPDVGLVGGGQPIEDILSQTLQ